MLKDVFISYSSRDRGIAEKICAFLESSDIICWIAPRDVRPGYDWDEEIIDAIDQVKAVVLILSQNSNESIHVKHEVGQAVSKEKAIFPIRIQNVEPSKKIALHLSTTHWLDAWTPPLEEKLLTLSNTLKELLGTKGEKNESRKEDDKPVCTQQGKADGSTQNQTNSTGEIVPPKGMVVVTNLQGDSAEVIAESLKYYMGVGPFAGVSDALYLSTGVKVPFSKLKSFEIIDVDEKQEQVTLKISLLNGRTVTEKMGIGYGYRLCGENDLGEFIMQIRNIKRVDF